MERIGVIRDNGVVINVIVWSDHTPEQLLADGFTDFEEVTSGPTRPGIGWTWNKKDGYRSPQPFPSWSWKDGDWQAPEPMPSEGNYQWDETTQQWNQLPVVE